MKLVNTRKIVMKTITHPSQLNENKNPISIMGKRNVFKFLCSKFKFLIIWCWNVFLSYFKLFIHYFLHFLLLLISIVLLITIFSIIFGSISFIMYYIEILVKDTVNLSINLLLNYIKYKQSFLQAKYGIYINYSFISNIDFFIKSYNYININTGNQYSKVWTYNNTSLNLNYKCSILNLSQFTTKYVTIINIFDLNDFITKYVIFTNIYELKPIEQDKILYLLNLYTNKINPLIIDKIIYNLKIDLLDYKSMHTLVNLLESSTMDNYNNLIRTDYSLNKLPPLSPIKISPNNYMINELSTINSPLPFSGNKNSPFLSPFLDSSIYLKWNNTLNDYKEITKKLENLIKEI